MQIILKKQTVDVMNSINTGTRLINYFDRYVNHLDEMADGSIKDAFEDIDNNTNSWGEMFRVLGSFLDNEIKEETAKVMVIVK